MTSYVSNKSVNRRNLLKVSQIFRSAFTSEDDSSTRKPSCIQRSLTVPFAPSWAFGVDVLTKFINLTKYKSSYKIFYSVSHVGIIYSHATHDMQFLMGHRNLITSIAKDDTGKWLVSADNGEDNSIIVWDSDDCIPVHTIFNAHPPDGLRAIAMSHDAKFLVSIGFEPDPIVKFWLWTYGRDEADAIYTAKHSYGEVKFINFNPNECTHFVITFSEGIVFFTWHNKELTSSVGEIPHKRAKNYGFYTDTTYMPYSHECLSVTTNGWIIVWGLTFFTVPYESMEDNNNKIFIKAIRLQKEGIGSICYVDGVISTTDFRGNIRFYDEKLQILYLCHKFTLPPIVMTGFNLMGRKFIIQDPTDLNTDKHKKKESHHAKYGEEQIEDETRHADENRIKHEIEYITEGHKKTCEDVGEEDLIKYEAEYVGEEHEIKDETDIVEEQEKINDNNDDNDDSYADSYDSDEDRSDIYEKIYLNLLPSDFTLQRSPFLVRDYIILTTNGQFAYVDAIESKVHYFLTTNFSAITSMDVHNDKPILILGYMDGSLYTYNYETCSLIVKKRIMNLKEERYNEISNVRYSPGGLFLVCGTGGGHLWFVDPVTLHPLEKKPFIYEHSKIVDIKFSLDNHYLAYYDVSKAVCLLKRKDNEGEQNPEWVFHGRFIAHTKQITGMLFCDNDRLFSISEDKNIVEYYVKESKPGKLEIISRIPVVQRGYPVAFTTYDILSEEGNIYFLIATNDYKYLIMNEETSTLERTLLAPFLGTPVQQLKIIPNNNNKYIMFSTYKYLGIQMLPISGNPFKQVTLIAHSSHIQHFRICNEGRYAFTFGINDNVCLMWDIKTESVEYMNEQGGLRLSQYYALIEGGAEGWLFQEMKDLFYYMQILHQGEDSPFPRNVSDKIPTAELPNLMRAIGYYPSENELDNILYEVKYFYAENSGDDEEVINFENFVKLYINHRPVKSFKKNEIKWAFQTLGKDGKISRQNFINILCTKGEAFSNLSLQHCLSILTHQNKDEIVPRYTFNEMIPEELTYEYFMSEILGVENSDF